MYRLHERLVAIRTEYNLRLKAGVAAPVTQVTQVTVQSTQRRPELEDSTLRYLQDLLAWVEENQRRVDGAEWGMDLPSVEAQLGSHRGLHQSIEEFRAKVERARTDEVSWRPGAGASSGPSGLAPRPHQSRPAGPALPGHPRRLPGLPGPSGPAVCQAAGECRPGGGVGGQQELGGSWLTPACPQNSSKARLRSLESLHGFVAAATKELMWLSEKEEEEVGFDWSERNANMAAKKESYSVRPPCPPSLHTAPRQTQAPRDSGGIGGLLAGRPPCGPDTVPSTRCHPARP